MIEIRKCLHADKVCPHIMNIFILLLCLLLVMSVFVFVKAFRVYLFSSIPRKG